MAGMLTWNEFVSAVANAAALISVDTVTGHLAACFRTPSIILLSGRWGAKFFRTEQHQRDNNHASGRLLAVLSFVWLRGNGLRKANYSCRCIVDL